jgi:hypothetical protein
LVLPIGSHCGAVYRCLSNYPFGPNDFGWRWSYDFGPGVANGERCDGSNACSGSFICPTTSYTCDSNSGEWLVSFCSY